MAQGSSGFTLEELYTQAKMREGNYLKFIDNDKLTSGIYQLKKGEEDRQQPHEWDEIYYVLEGKAQLKADDQIYDVVQGSILYVKAKIDHRFVSIEEDLKILVFFSKMK